MAKNIEQILIDTIKIGKSGFSGEQQVYGIFNSARKIRKQFIEDLRRLRTNCSFDDHTCIWREIKKLEKEYSK